MNLPPIRYIVAAFKNFIYRKDLVYQTRMLIWPHPNLPYYLFFFKKEKVLDIIAFPVFFQRKKPEEKWRENSFKENK